MIHLILLAQITVTVPAQPSQTLTVVKNKIVIPAVPAKTITAVQAAPPVASGGCASAPTATGCKVVSTVTATCTTYSDSTFACVPIASANANATVTPNGGFVRGIHADPKVLAEIAKEVGRPDTESTVFCQYAGKGSPPVATQEDDHKIGPIDCGLMLDSNPAKITCLMNQLAPGGK